MLSLSGVVYTAVYWGCLLLGALALIDALTRRPDAFVAADRQTKPTWLALLGGGLVAQVLFSPLGGGLLGILGLAGITAAIVYLVDVRKRLIDVVRGPRW